MSVHQCDTETAAQRIYEEQLHTSGHLDDSMDECSDRMDKTSSSSITQKKGYAKTRMSTFCHKFVKPAFPEAITDIKILHGMTALERRVKNEINDAGLCPEVAKMAQVRRGLELCPEERAFLVKRKQHVRDHFAKYLGLNPQEVHPDDVPRISFGGSGGGFRAMIGVLSYADEMKAAGPLDCLTYVYLRCSQQDGSSSRTTQLHIQVVLLIMKLLDFRPPGTSSLLRESLVPTWAFGRPFEHGRSTMQLPEQSLALLLGLATNAPAGPRTSYIFTISRNLPVGFLGSSVHTLAHGLTRLWGKEGTEEFQNHHPLHACNEHNFMYHYTPVKPDAHRAPGLENSPRIHLIDSGMDNNCPTVVLLHPQRKCDVMINMDASSDVQKDTFRERVDQIKARLDIYETPRHVSRR
ncbi:uncharacterized protein MYCGRDRAFT_89921 [Zymoseptoria tritici IPO323]|uniref:Lysophospholipase n=1 Tax=Zymoseptoria tritici (strain CBS 115943 / IPO323) TaxID=336722 RepID=F9WWW9_ZYMTI|nr:uncharacterized protein MYCGRDRAFT_89921 [Zymoseptoria tritici IPO323]EGP91587.1 hypothetical protein MYCGRDRAFT_89921 [Zymoseptoria tritici IPO323]